MLPDLTVPIEIGADAITAGKPCNPTDCPIAVALAWYIEDHTSTNSSVKVRVYSERVVITEQTKDDVPGKVHFTLYHLPKDARDFVDLFDDEAQQCAAKPFTLKLEAVR